MAVKKKQPVSFESYHIDAANNQIKNGCLKNLKNKIAGIDRQVSRHLMPLGVEALDSALSGGLALGRVHMLCGMMQAHGVVSGFVIALLIRLVAHLSIAGKIVGPIVWCPASSLSGAGMLYGHGLTTLGLDPARLLIVNTPHPTRRMAALDDIVRTDGLVAVVAEYDGIQKSSDYWMRLMRRTQLAAESSQAIVFLLGAPIMANGCETIWHVGPTKVASNVPSETVEVLNQPWSPTWDLTLQRARRGYPFHGHIGWDISSGKFVELAGVVRVKASGQTLSDTT
jgi:hypothetical protein